mmetsp:Transcript_4849/g.10648  ORF Transcript_4849/g.10648 Transcript_4849/m.10648 type:complete len:217 (-) Transcript_4849:785-1435(-)
MSQGLHVVRQLVHALILADDLVCDQLQRRLSLQHLQSTPPGGWGRLGGRLGKQHAVQLCQLGVFPLWGLCSCLRRWRRGSNLGCGISRHVKDNRGRGREAIFNFRPAQVACIITEVSNSACAQFIDVPCGVGDVEQPVCRRTPSQNPVGHQDPILSDCSCPAEHFPHPPARFRELVQDFCWLSPFRPPRNPIQSSSSLNNFVTLGDQVLGQHLPVR